MATPSELLAQAEAAYHSLVTGTQARVIVDQNGERVEFTAARRADLYAYIQELKGLADPGGCVGPGPMNFYF